MDTDPFEHRLREDGYTELVTRVLEPGYFLGDHAHPFDARALVTAGDITLTVAGEARRYPQGTIFELPAGCTHDERAGPAGVTYRVGRRTPPAA